MSAIFQRVIFPVQSLNHLFFPRYKNRHKKLAGAVCGICHTSFLRAYYTKTALGLAILLVLLLIFVLVLSAAIRELRVFSLIRPQLSGWRCDSRLLALPLPTAACLPTIHHSPKKILQVRLLLFSASLLRRRQCRTFGFVSFPTIL